MAFDTAKDIERKYILPHLNENGRCKKCDGKVERLHTMNEIILRCPKHGQIARKVIGPHPIL